MTEISIRNINGKDWIQLYKETIAKGEIYNLAMAFDMDEPIGVCFKLFNKNFEQAKERILKK